MNIPCSIRNRDSLKAPFHLTPNAVLHEMHRLSVRWRHVVVAVEVQKPVDDVDEQFIVHRMPMFQCTRCRSLSAHDNFAVVGNTKLDITAGEVGVPIVFRINADDGQRLQIDINQDGDFDDAGELVINDDVLSGDHNVDSPGLTFSAEGAYAIRYTFFEAGGGAEGEVSASVDGAAFVLVGGAGGLGIVPEPGVTALAGLVGLLGLTRRRR